jgi:multidrug resistance efflux pump
MDEKKLYQQKYQAQLDEWKADVAKLKAKASAADANAKLAMNKHIETLERKLEEAQEKLAELGETSGEKWISVKHRAELAWTSLKSGVREAASQFRE